MRAQTPQQHIPELGQTPPRQHRRQETPLQFDGLLTQRAESNLLPQPVQHQQRSSISKLPLDDGGDAPNAQPLRSIFPTYNPNVPLGQQDYAPTAKSPNQIPRAVISRQSWRDPHPDEDGSGHNLAHSPRGGEPAPHRWAQPRPSEPPVVPKTSSTEQLRSFWKVANGWQASSSEGRVYCMKLTQEKDAPVYTLSSSSQPFYNIRLDPTSASARVTVMRHDPTKPYKDSAAEAASSSPSILGALAATGGSDPSSLSSSKMTDGKHWQETLTTTLEEESRRHRPEDGLVAVLMPTPATKMALEKANDPQAQMMAERECGRLVWDDDSDSYFLVHPALATPFCVTIERSPAWSRVEYTLEHHESPKHLAKLTRDGTGGGWIEVDTGLASKIEAFYVVDVAITALMLVANADERNQPAPIEPFEPPPSLSPPAALIGAPPPAHKKNKKSLFGSKKPQMEAFEIDLESQDDSVRKESKNKVKVREGIDKLPFVIRAPLKVVKGLFKAFIWVLTILFKCLKFMFTPCYRLVGSKY
ncbi:uncharacterized protein J7T54_006707 [Emericellopsis cladophorae]|uniref:Acetylserotonin methytransferase-like protein n=1 Tax=Emericellopsis cladophorae TaxID=2686198 RepID=A0A9P9Y716_9HYPO|nr:uncharacterized protein J7T54_006707 [Emericellopsis cladophorae]KAI6784661.1 hypothetical protein J7T54_006707 [Emericellopsis cladophorae]